MKRLRALIVGLDFCGRRHTMPTEPYGGLETNDAEVRRLMANQHGEELRLAEDLLTCYLKGFGHLGSFTRTSSNGLQYAWFLLTARSFNSLRSAHALLRQGYYDQAIMLVRSVEEDWLTATDCEYTPETLRALLDDEGQLGKGRLTWTEMAKRMPDEAREAWQYNYGSLSRIAHPRGLALRILVDPDTRNLRLGGQYDRMLFISVGHAWFLSAIKMLDFLKKVLGDNAQPWQEETWPKLKAVADWCETLEAEVNASEDV